MKKLLLVLMLLAGAALPSRAQMSGAIGPSSPDCSMSFTATATGRSLTLDNRKLGCSAWTMFWSNTSAVSTFSVELDGAPEAGLGQPGTWAALPSSSSGVNPAVSGTNGSVSSSFFQPWISVNVATLTGGGSVTVMLMGWRSTGGVVAEKGTRWSVVSAPAAGSQGTASKAAGGAGVRHVADCIGFSGGSTAAPAATALTINLRDGATGAGTIIWSHTVVVLAATGQNVAPFTACGLGLVGTANTAMTLEFSALLTNLAESVSLSGYDGQ